MTPSDRAAQNSLESILGPADPAPFRLFDEQVPGPFVLVSDHAGRHVPEVLGDMGVPPTEWERHIACDIGIKPVGRLLREALGCALVEQVYSRLVIDANRSPGHPASIPPASDGTPVPANADVVEKHRYAREKDILLPYHACIATLLAERAGRETALVALHSFTSEMKGQKRPWHVGLLHDHDTRSARIMQALLKEEEGLCIGDNEPYVLSPANDYTVPRHAASQGLPALEIEIRQDLIAEAAGQKEWAERLARLLPRYWQLYQEGAG